jgi:hypothetical protein
MDAMEIGIVAIRTDDAACKKVNSDIRKYESIRTRGNLQDIVDSYLRCLKMDGSLKLDFTGNRDSKISELSHDTIVVKVLNRIETEVSSLPKHKTDLSTANVARLSPYLNIVDLSWVNSQ